MNRIFISFDLLGPVLGSSFGLTPFGGSLQLFIVTCVFFLVIIAAGSAEKMKNRFKIETAYTASYGSLRAAVKRSV